MLFCQWGFLASHKQGLEFEAFDCTRTLPENHTRSTVIVLMALSTLSSSVQVPSVDPGCCMPSG